MSFAGFNSSKFVKGRLQAALYWIRKKRRTGAGGGGAAPDPSTTTFNVTDNGGEPLAVSEGDFLVRT